MPDFDRGLNLENMQAEYSQNLVTFLRTIIFGNSFAKVKNAFAFAFAPSFALA
jgi:hypothetical protein